MTIKEKFRLDKHIALFGTDQGLYVAILDDDENIIRLSVFGEKKGDQDDNQRD